ncbi:MAG: hypothetical protein LV481_06780 [Methylacidiphilales bacterium]|nr:hypothetical protein [Candidatus Methylacidiphilales bacterium]
MSPFSRKFLLTAVLAAWPVAAQANIGEDITQLRARYGSPQEAGNQILFQHKGYSICVYFDGIHSGMEVFVRDGSIPDKTDFTEEDIKEVLADEGEGLTWNEAKVSSGKRTWIRSDNKLIARFTEGDKPEDKYLVIMLNAK